MSYPPTSGTNGYTLASSSGVTTLLWGTDGLLVSPAPGGSFAGTGFYIVESVDQETDAEVIHGENGTGQKAWRIIINNGQKWTISVQDDTSMTPPIVGSTASILDGANLLGGGRVTIASCRVVASGERFSKKGAAMRNITVEKLTLVD
jgi:hypothetical protein